MGGDPLRVEFWNLAKGCCKSAQSFRLKGQLLPLASLRIHPRYLPNFKKVQGRFINESMQVVCGIGVAPRKNGHCYRVKLDGP